MKRFDSTKPKYAHLFRTTTLLINFLHMRHVDITYEGVGDLIINLATHGWVGISSCRCKIALTPNLNSSSMITLTSLTTSNY